MKLYLEYNNDNKRKGSEISSLSIVGDMVFTKNDFNNFMNYAEKMIFDISKLKNYNLYFFTIKKINNINSKVENYKKIYKSDFYLNKVDNFKLGLEIKEENYFFTLFQFFHDDILKVFHFLKENPLLNFILLSEKNLLSEESIRNIFYSSKIENDKINFVSLSSLLCLNNDMIIVLGDACEEKEFDVLFNSKIEKYMLKYYEKMVKLSRI